MSRAIPARARQLAAELKRRLARGAELARKLRDAHRRLQGANDRLWWGLHPDGIALAYDQHPAAVDVAFAENRCQVLGAPDPLLTFQQTHRQIHKAHHVYPRAAEDRGQRAANIGEIVRTVLDELVAVGWSEPEAQSAERGTVAAAQPWALARVDADGDPIEKILACSGDRAKGSSAGLSSCDRVIQRSLRTSVLQPGDMDQWPVGVYLLTGCWATLGDSVLAGRSIAHDRGAGETQTCMELERDAGAAMGGALLGHRPAERGIPVRVRRALLPALSQRRSPAQADVADGDGCRWRTAGSSMTSRRR